MRYISCLYQPEPGTEIITHFHPKSFLLRTYSRVVSLFKLFGIAHHGRNTSCNGSFGTKKNRQMKRPVKV